MVTCMFAPAENCPVARQLVANEEDSEEAQ
jgi:hypothetical protein